VSWTKEDLARMIAERIPTGSLVNLGIGMPLIVSDYLNPSSGVVLHSENGIFGLGGRAQPGEEDRDLVDAGKQYVTLAQGAAITDQVDSFALVHAGYLDLAVLGAYQVSVGGDLANWQRPDEKIAGVGGAVDIAMSAREVWVMMYAESRDGSPKLVPRCSYPLTAQGVVSRIYTDLAVLEPDADKSAFRVVEMAPGVEPLDLAKVVDGELV
jgi:3-oxoadipate CoA-transferase, beta subunit